MAKGPLIELTDLIEFASTQAEKIFRLQGVLYPLYHAITTSGETQILNAMDGVSGEFYFDIVGFIDLNGDFFVLHVGDDTKDSADGLDALPWL